MQIISTQSCVLLYFNCYRGYKRSTRICNYTGRDKTFSFNHFFSFFSNPQQTRGVIALSKSAQNECCVFSPQNIISIALTNGSLRLAGLHCRKVLVFLLRAQSDDYQSVFFMLLTGLLYPRMGSHQPRTHQEYFSL